jgi:hypothetical protein
MIYLECPTCDTRLRLKDAQPGKIALCPGCKCKFRIPAVPEGDNLAPAPRRKSQPNEDADQPSPAVRKHRRTEASEDLSFDEDETEQAPVRGRRRRGRKRSSALRAARERFADLVVYWGNIGLPILVLGLLALLSLGLCRLWPQAWLPLLVVGGCVALVGELWYSAIALQDVGLAGMWYPNLLAPLYILQNFDAVKRPVFLNLAGSILIVVGLFFRQGQTTWPRSGIDPRAASRSAEMAWGAYDAAVAQADADYDYDAYLAPYQQAQRGLRCLPERPLRSGTLSGRRNVKLILPPTIPSRPRRACFQSCCIAWSLTRSGWRSATTATFNPSVPAGSPCCHPELSA